MNGLLKVSVIIFILLYVSGLQAKTVQQQAEHKYFTDDQLSWTEIAPNGETVIAASSMKSNLDVKVTIRMHIEQNSKPGDRNCRCDHFIDIVVNGEKIIVPYSVFCELNDLNRGKVFIERKNMILMLDGGDASEGYYVKIEFDREHVTRKAVYVDTSLSPNALLEETIYHIVVIE